MSTENKTPIPPQKILVVRLKAIGDVIMATPSVRALRKAFPSTQIHFLTRSINEPILRHNPHLDRLWIYPEKGSSWMQMVRFLRGVRAERFDWVFDLEATPRTAWTTFLTGAPVRVGYAFRVRQWVFTHPVPKNKVRRFQGDICSSLIEFLGVPIDGSPTELFLGEEEKNWAREYFSKPEVISQKWRIGLNPTGAWSSKRWPTSRWRELIPLLNQELGVKPLMFWGPGSENLVKEITQGLEDQVLLKPETTLLEAAAYVSKLDLLIGSDGTPQHMAQALGTPSLTLWGPGWGLGWTLPNDPRHRYLQYFLDCGPCDKTLCPHPEEKGTMSHYHRECLDLIEPRTVLELAYRMLGV